MTKQIRMDRALADWTNINPNGKAWEFAAYWITLNRSNKGQPMRNIYYYEKNDPSNAKSVSCECCNIGTTIQALVTKGCTIVGVH